MNLWERFHAENAETPIKFAYLHREIRLIPERIWRCLGEFPLGLELRIPQVFLRLEEFCLASALIL